MTIKTIRLFKNIIEQIHIKRFSNITDALIFDLFLTCELVIMLTITLQLL